MNPADSIESRVFCSKFQDMFMEFIILVGFCTPARTALSRFMQMSSLDLRRFVSR